MNGNPYLEIINQQGAQVTALRQELDARETIIAALASGATKLRFGKTTLEQITETIQAVSWRVLKDGTLVIEVKKQRK